MKFIFPAVIALLPLLAGCPSEEVSRDMYEALSQKDCIDRTGSPNCDPEHKSYDQYEKERDESLKKQ